MRHTIKMCTAFSLCVTVSACSGGGPDQLAASLETALKSGDMDAALALLDSKNIPSAQKFFYVYNVLDCTYRLTCTVKAVPLNEEFTKRATAQKAKGYEMGAAEGLVEVTQTGEHEKGSMTMPYAKVNGAYKILGTHLTVEKLAKLRAQTAQSVADDYLKDGVGDPPDPQWKDHATALPADGGEVGAALVALVKSRSEAIKAGDVEKRIALGDERDAIIYAAKDGNDKDVPLKLRQFKMRAQALRELADVKVLGGYRNGDTAVLTIEGHDGNGWIVRGAQLMQLENGKWNTDTSVLTSTPAA